MQEVTDEFILTDSGFRSEDFSRAPLEELIGACPLRPLAGIAFAITF